MRVPSTNKKNHFEKDQSDFLQGVQTNRETLMDKNIVLQKPKNFHTDIYYFRSLAAHTTQIHAQTTI